MQIRETFTRNAAVFPLFSTVRKPRRHGSRRVIIDYHFRKITVEVEILFVGLYLQLQENRSLEIECCLDADSVLRFTVGITLG